MADSMVSLKAVWKERPRADCSVLNLAVSMVALLAHLKKPAPIFKSKCGKKYKHSCEPLRRKQNEQELLTFANTIRYNKNRSLDGAKSFMAAL